MGLGFWGEKNILGLEWRPGMMAQSWIWRRESDSGVGFNLDSFAVAGDQ
jgi:hypothetical protein